MAGSTRLAALVAGLALLAGGCGADSTVDDGQAPAGGTSVSPEGTAADSTELSFPGAQGGRCMAPSVDNLRAQDTAFEGTVTDVDGDVAVLDVDRVYAGDSVETVSVALPPEGMADLLGASDFERGRTYLVSSLDGQVSVCGLSGPKDELLTGLYEDAFGG